ncbi:MAG: metal-sensitive transcriptional regulator [Defluviitaleaceae bacterium]|nr:metal-sensitive transcriptional regulator [Defluviitaleaceae bacterium]
MVNSNTCTDCNIRIDDETTERPAKIKKDLIGRLNRVEGQVRGIKSMIEKDVYCDDVLTQIAAVQSAMSSVGKILLESHMRSCVANRMKNGDEEIIEEFIKTVARLYK